MPTVSNCVVVTKDRQHIYATGVYKPTIRCYDCNQLSQKFERCVDSEIIKFLMLSDDYTKFCLLQCDRYIEFHSQFGRYYRTRVPKYARDFAYDNNSCDLYVVGVSQEIYRLNLEQGRFMQPLVSDSTEITCCEFNPDHNLFTCGTKDGFLECYDPRAPRRAGRLDCGLHLLPHGQKLSEPPGISSLKYRDAFNIGLGSTSGFVSLYDIRATKPVLVRDLRYGLPIQKICFHKEQDLGPHPVLTIDKKILKIWNRVDGKIVTSVEPESSLNDLCVFPESGLIFLANESPRILTYYIPTLGTAPKWCSFLDNLTEELEEDQAGSVYDDYKFVTRNELDSLGLSHLIGSNLLKAYMHGYFLDIRLYTKAKSIVEPVLYADYKKRKVQERIEQERRNRVKIKKLPSVNRVLAEKLLMQDDGVEATTTRTRKQKRRKSMPNLMEDTRFSKIFENPDFEIDPASSEFKLLNPVVSKLDRNKSKAARESNKDDDVMENDDVISDKSISDDESSSDDEETKNLVKEQYRIIGEERKEKRKQIAKRTGKFKAKLRPGQSNTFSKLLEVPAGDTKIAASEKTLSLSDRLEAVGEIIRSEGGNRRMTYNISNRAKLKRLQDEQHHKERKLVRRSAGDIEKQIKIRPKFWRGKRVR